METNAVKQNRLLPKVVLFCVAVSVLFGTLAFWQASAIRNALEQSAMNLAVEKVMMLRDVIREKDSFEYPDESFFELYDHDAQEGYLIFQDRDRSRDINLFANPATLRRIIPELRPGIVYHERMEENGKPVFVTGTVLHLHNTRYSLIYFMDFTFMSSFGVLVQEEGYWLLILGTLLLVFTGTACWLAWRLDLMRQRMRDGFVSTGVEARRILNLDGTSIENQVPNVRDDIWSADMMTVFIKELKKRNTKPVTLVSLEFSSREERSRYLHDGAVYFNPYILRFVRGETGMLLIFIHYNEQETRAILDVMSRQGKYIKEVRELDYENIS